MGTTNGVKTVAEKKPFPNLVNHKDKKKGGLMREHTIEALVCW